MSVLNYTPALEPTEAKGSWKISPLLELQDERTFIHLDWVELASRETNWTPLSAHENTWQQKDLHFAWFFAYTNKNNSSPSCQDCILGGPAPDAYISSITVAAPRAVLMQPWSEIGWKPGTEHFCFNVSTPGEEWRALQGSIALPYIRNLMSDRIHTQAPAISFNSAASQSCHLSRALCPPLSPSVPFCPPLSPSIFIMCCIQTQSDPISSYLELQEWT